VQSAYYGNRRSAAAENRARREEIMMGLSFQTCVVLDLCTMNLRGGFRMNDRALLSGKEIDVVFPRAGTPKVLIEINEANHETAAARKRDTLKRDLAMFRYPGVEWVTITQRGYLENPKAEIGKVITALQRVGLLPIPLVHSSSGSLAHSGRIREQDAIIPLHVE
jgi:hypothetical protein